jgi:hypothetical protein
MLARTGEVSSTVFSCPTAVSTDGYVGLVDDDSSPKGFPMARRQILTLVARGLLVTSAVAPLGVVAWEQGDPESSALVQVADSEPDTLFINGRSFILE